LLAISIGFLKIFRGFFFFSIRKGRILQAITEKKHNTGTKKDFPAL
jgi:hypothetical protein